MQKHVFICSRPARMAALTLAMHQLGQDAQHRRPLSNRKPPCSGHDNNSLSCSACAGFHHASYTFAHESQVHRANIDPNLVPAGALVAFIQKGMQYMEMEGNIEVGMHGITGIWLLTWQATAAAAVGGRRPGHLSLQGMVHTQLL